MNPDIAAAFPRLVEAGALPPPGGAPSLGKKEAPARPGKLPVGRRKLPGDKGSFPWEKGSFPETREASRGKKEASRRRGKSPREKGSFPRDEGGFPWEKGGSRETREASLRKRKLPPPPGSFRRPTEASPPRRHDVIPDTAGEGAEAHQPGRWASAPLLMRCRPA